MFAEGNPGVEIKDWEVEVLKEFSSLSGNGNVLGNIERGING